MVDPAAYTSIRKQKGAIRVAISPHLTDSLNKDIIDQLQHASLEEKPSQEESKQETEEEKNEEIEGDEEPARPDEPAGFLNSNHRRQKT